MHDKIIQDRLQAVSDHIQTIEHRMAGIHDPEDFLTEEGAVIFDAILIRLQALGENIKKIESVQPGSLIKHFWWMLMILSGSEILFPTIMKS